VPYIAITLINPKLSTFLRKNRPGLKTSRGESSCGVAKAVQSVENIAIAVTTGSSEVKSRAGMALWVPAAPIASG
jgi:hypothetical protein